MKCGLDLGSTLMKAALLDETNGNYFFISTKKLTDQKFDDQLIKLDPSEIYCTGVGPNWLPDKLKVRIKNLQPEDVISQEFDLQVKGARRLLKFGNHSFEDFTLVSIGTGTSYTNVTKELYQTTPFGNFIGGGFLAGISSQIIGFGTGTDNTYSDAGVRLNDLDGLAESVLNDSNMSDILIKDKVKSAAGTMMGEFMISSCGKLNSDSDMEYACLGLINCVASTIMRDITMYRMSGQLPSDNIVVVGTTITSCRTLRKLLTKYCTMFGLSIYIPDLADYTGALGALSQLGV